MNPPPILISDWTNTPPTATHYIHGSNTLDLRSTYTLIKSLLTYPACHHRRSETTWPCTPCATAFQDLYWTCASHLLDYFADFLAHDTPLMQSIWFHLLDIWQESAAYLPFADVLEEARAVSPRRIWGHADAERFSAALQETITLVSATIYGAARVNKEKIGEAIVHDPRGIKQTPVGAYETGPWISGLKPWQQFLCAGSPGVAARTLPCDGEGKDGQGKEEGKGVREGLKNERHIPSPALAILSKHTLRARRLAEKHHLSFDPSPSSLLGHLSTFDAYSVPFPTEKHQKEIYTSPLTGRTYTYTLYNGAPPVVRWPAEADPENTVKAPDLNMLDECVGIHKGWEGYEGFSGDGEAGDDYELEEGTFDMWVVRETGRAGGGGGGGMDAALMAGFEDMFEEWYCG